MKASATQVRPPTSGGGRVWSRRVDGGADRILTPVAWSLAILLSAGWAVALLAIVLWLI